MAIHIGKMIQARVEELRLTQKEFGELINKNEKTVPDIYKRDHKATDLILEISKALKIDLVKYLYEDESLKNLRNDEVTQLKNENQELREDKKRMAKEMERQQELIDTQKGFLSVVTEQLLEYKRKAGYDPENKSGNI